MLTSHRPNTHRWRFFAFLSNVALNLTAYQINQPTNQQPHPPHPQEKPNTYRSILRSQRPLCHIMFSRPQLVPRRACRPRRTLLRHQECRTLLVCRWLAVEQREEFVPQDSFDALEGMRGVPSIAFLLCSRV